MPDVQAGLAAQLEDLEAKVAAAEAKTGAAADPRPNAYQERETRYQALDLMARIGVNIETTTELLDTADALANWLRDGTRPE